MVGTRCMHLGDQRSPTMEPAVHCADAEAQLAQHVTWHAALLVGGAKHARNRSRICRRSHFIHERRPRDTESAPAATGLDCLVHHRPPGRSQRADRVHVLRDQARRATRERRHRFGCPHHHRNRRCLRDLFRPRATPSEEAQVAKIASLVVKFGALAFVLGINTQNAINLQLLGGIWILQTFPSIAIGLFTRWLHRWGLILGWLVGMIYGTYQAYGVSSPTVPHFAGSIALIPIVGQTGYIALTALVLNLVISVVVTLILRLRPSTAGSDITTPDDYLVDASDARLEPLFELAGTEAEGVRS